MHTYIGKQNINANIKASANVNIKYQNNHYFMNKYNNINMQELNQNNVFITLTTTPSRLYSDDIINVLNSLILQTIRPKKIFLIICDNYIRNFSITQSKIIETTRINYIKDNMPLIEIIKTKDYGPATKLLGLLEHNQKNNFLIETDQIIVVDDDMIYSNNLVMSHVKCYQLYNCDICAVNEKSMIKNWTPYTFNNYDIFYEDNYIGFLYGWLSFSITFRATQNLMNFYINLIEKYPDVIYDDDLIFTLYMYQNKLYVVENKFITLNNNNERTAIDSIDALRNKLLSANLTKYDLRNKIYLHNNIKIKYGKFIDKKTTYTIFTYIPKRNFYLIKNINVEKYNEDLHIVFTYHDECNMMMTVTVFNTTLFNTNHEIIFTLDNIDQSYKQKYSILINIQNCMKFTHIICITDNNNNNTLYSREHYNANNNSIMQTDAHTNISRRKFYSVMTILNFAPEFTYKYYDNNNVFSYIKNNYAPILYDAIMNLKPGAYIADLFRYCYLYLNGGVYMDCKKIMYISLSKYILNTITDIKLDDIFIKDCIHNYAYNAIMICNRFSEVMKQCIINCVITIIQGKYNEDPLSITGPHVLGNAIDYVYDGKYNYNYLNVVPIKNNDWLSYNVNKDGTKVIKNTYYGYYDENNYKNTNHYHVLWYKKNIYKQNLSKKYKNIIDKTDVILF